SQTVTLDGTGHASVTTSSLLPNDCTVTASYLGSGNFSSSQGNTTQTVNKADTTTTVSSAPNPSVSGQAVTLRATVTATSPGSGTPSGTVTFNCDNTTQTGTLNSSGVATVTTSSLTPGTYTITANYLGDTNFQASQGTGSQT